MITPSPFTTLAVPVLEVGLPLTTAFSVLVVSLLHSPAGSPAVDPPAWHAPALWGTTSRSVTGPRAVTRSILGARAVTAALVTLCLVAATALWVLGPDLSASRWAELQLLWMAPTLLWAGLAAAVAAPRRERPGTRTPGDHGSAGRRRPRLLGRGRQPRRQQTDGQVREGTTDQKRRIGQQVSAAQPPRARGGRSRPVVTPALRLLVLAGAGTGLSWFSALPPVQLLLLAPRQLSWPGPAGADSVYVGQSLELFLPALTTFHGRMVTWAPNRVVLLALGVLACWMAWCRWRDHARAGTSGTGRQARPGRRRGITVGTSAAVVTACALLALLHPTQVATWRLGWSEGRLRVPVTAQDPTLGTIEVSYQLHPATQAQTSAPAAAPSEQSAVSEVSPGSNLATGETSGGGALANATPEPARDRAQISGTARAWPGAPVVVAAVGGPSAASQSKGQLLGALGQLGRTHDVLLSDYRGFGRSHPVGCPGVDVGAADPADVAACRQRLGTLADHLSAQASAADLDAVRAALGIERWDLYGQSYGTFFAQTYARTHPDAVRSMVLDSSLPLAGPPLWTYMADGLPTPADPGAWEQVVHQAREEHWRSPSVGELALVHLYSAWPEVGAPRDAALRLDPAQRQQALALLGRDLPTQLAGMRADPLARLMPAPAQGVYACNDFPMPFERRQTPGAREESTRAYAEAHLSADVAPFTWQEVDQAARVANGLDVHTFRYPACLAWRYPASGSEPHPGDGAVTRQGHLGGPTVGPREGPEAGSPEGTLQGSVPVLVVSGSLDTTTTPAMAAQVAATWGASVLTVTGGDHFVLLDSSCAQASVATFVLDPRGGARMRCTSPS